MSYPFWALVLGSALLVVSSSLGFAGLPPETKFHRNSNASLVSSTARLPIAQSTPNKVPPQPAASLLSGSWTNVTSAVMPSPPSECCSTMAFDLADGYMVMFGGIFENGSLGNLTSIFSSGQWQTIHPDPSPSPRYGAGMAYVPRMKEVILFGGTPIAGGPSALHDTWGFSNGSWKNLTRLTGPAPPQRFFAGFTYDSADRYALLFGGVRGGNTYLNDTWAFDGKWTNLTNASSPAPSARYGPQLAFDGAFRTVLLFSGQTSSGTFPSDLWSFGHGSWVELNATSAPQGRGLAGMVYDAANRTLILFGGQISTGVGSASDTWVLSAGGWHRLRIVGSHPNEEFAMAWDSSIPGALLFGGTVIGGSGGYRTTDSTWELAISG